MSPECQWVTVTCVVVLGCKHMLCAGIWVWLASLWQRRRQHCCCCCCCQQQQALETAGSVMDVCTPLAGAGRLLP
jgi:hypothetical protein